MCLFEAGAAPRKFGDMYVVCDKGPFAEIGPGRFSTVVRAFSKCDPAAPAVAVKIVLKSGKTRIDKVTQTEAHFLRKIEHPHIIHALDFFDEPKKFYMVMDLVEGGDLFNRIKQARVCGRTSFGRSSIGSHDVFAVVCLRRRSHAARTFHARHAPAHRSRRSATASGRCPAFGRTVLPSTNQLMSASPRCARDSVRRTRRRTRVDSCGRCSRRSTTCTRAGSCTATSSRRTCCFAHRQTIGTSRWFEIGSGVVARRLIDDLAAKPLNCALLSRRGLLPSELVASSAALSLRRISTPTGRPRCAKASAPRRIWRPRSSGACRTARRSTCGARVSLRSSCSSATRPSSTRCQRAVVERGSSHREISESPHSPSARTSSKRRCGRASGIYLERDLSRLPTSSQCVVVTASGYDRPRHGRQRRLRSSPHRWCRRRCPCGLYQGRYITSTSIWGDGMVYMVYNPH